MSARDALPMFKYRITIRRSPFPRGSLVRLIGSDRVGTVIVSSEWDGPRILLVQFADADAALRVRAELCEPAASLVVDVAGLDPMGRD